MEKPVSRNLGLLVTIEKSGRTSKSIFVAAITWPLCTIYAEYHGTETLFRVTGYNGPALLNSKRRSTAWMIYVEDRRARNEMFTLTCILYMR